MSGAPSAHGSTQNAGAAGTAAATAIAHRRKQAHPQRSLKQLATVAEKVLHGIIVIDASAVWDTEDAPDTSDDDAAGSLIEGLASGSQSSKRTRGQTTGGATKKRRRDSTSGTESSLEQGLGSPSRGRGGSAQRYNAAAGVSLPADNDPDGVAHRLALYEALVVRRRSSGGPQTFGSGAGAPLDVSAAPGASMLDDDEVELCMALRLYPLQYFQSREILIANAAARGFYKKSAAQKMLRIDVNKTGKLYDFLVSRGWMPETPAEAGKCTPPPEVNWHAIDPAYVS